jgi:hypothetical protein
VNGQVAGAIRVSVRARITELTHFQKDVGLLGAALVFFAVNAFGGEFGPTLTDPLFSL